MNSKFERLDQPGVLREIFEFMYREEDGSLNPHKDVNGGDLVDLISALFNESIIGTCEDGLWESEREFLLDLSERLRNVPPVYGVDEGDSDRLRQIAKIMLAASDDASEVLATELRFLRGMRANEVSHGQFRRGSG